VSFVLDVMRRSSPLLVSSATAIGVIAAAIAAAFLFAVNNVPIASGQQQQLTSIPPVIENGTFQNTEDGIRLKLPDGWIVQDIDNFHLPNFRIADEGGFLLMAIICPQQEALLGIGGLYNCEQSNSSVEIRYDRLSHRPEFEAIEDPLYITPDDFLEFMIGEMQGRGYTNVTILNTTDVTINVTSPEDPNTTVRTVPAKQVAVMYQPSVGLTEMSSYSILATLPETPQPGLRQILSGYSVTYEAPVATTTTPAGSPPPPIQQMFQSLEFIRSVE
jgi:hypothetical protein